MDNSTTPSSKPKNRRGSGSRQKAALRYRCKKNDRVGSAIDHLSNLALSEDVDTAYEAFMRMSTLRHQIIHNLDFDDDIKDAISKKRRVEVSTNAETIGPVIILPVPEEIVAPPPVVQPVLVQSFEEDEGFSDDPVDITSNISVDIEERDEVDAPFDWATHVDKESPIRVDEQPTVSSYLDLSKRAIRDGLKKARQHSTRCAVIDVNEMTSCVLIKVPDEFYIPYWFQRRYKYRPIRFTKDIEEFRGFQGIRIYVEHHSRATTVHANVYIKYHHPGQVIFSINKVPMINPEYSGMQIDAIRGSL